MKVGKCNVEFLGRESLSLDGTNRECKFYSIKSVRKTYNYVNHHILLIDVSESMRDNIENLKKGIKETLRALKKEQNSYVSVIVYSKNSDVIVRTIRCDDVSYRVAKIYKCIEDNIYARENTLVSDGLEEASKLIDSLNESSVRHHIVFFTDGYISDIDCSKNDKEKCFKIVNDLKEKKVSLSIIGMGSYYDRNFLIEISNLSYQGRFNHMSDIKEFYKITSLEIKRVNNYEEVNLFIDNEEFFIVSMCDKRSSPSILTSIDINKPSVIVVFDDDLNIEGKVIKSSKKVLDCEYRAVFSYALARYYANLDDAVNMEKAIKISEDKNIYDSIANCYSFMEKGKAIELLDDVIFDKSKRFRLGKFKINDDEKNEPMCLLEILQEIMNDDECKLLWNYAYKYKRIGIKQKNIEDTYKFIRPSVGFGEVTSISIGNSKLNIGVKVRIDGAVQNEINKLKLDAHIYREYNLVSNGNINTEEICCILSKNAKSILRKEKLIKSTIKVYDKEICVLNLKNTKVANKRIATIIDDKTIAKYLYDIELLKCDLWALNKFIKEIFEGKNAKSSKNSISDEELKVRDVFRVDKDGIYSPLKVVKDSNPDYEFYISKVVDWKIEKFQKTKEKNASLEKFRMLVSGEMSESYKRVKAKQIELKREKEHKQNLVNIVKMANMLRGRSVFLWDDVSKKKKIETDPELKMNVIVGQTVNVSTKNINGFKIREDFYEVIKKFN